MDKGKWAKYSILGALALSAAVCLFAPKQQYSAAERRRLATAPTLSLSGIADKSFMTDAESYLLDHFPLRDTLRSMKAYFAYYVLGQKENNDIYLADGYAAKLEYPLRESQISRAAAKMTALQEQYFPENEVFYAIVPDKNYFLAKSNGYPSMEYDKIEALLAEGVTNMTYIPIWDTLSIEDYYHTDTHWRQECLADTVVRIGTYMGVDEYLTTAYEQQEIETFYGVYYGQSALPLSAEPLVYLSNDVIEQASCYDVEADASLPIYQMQYASVGQQSDSGKISFDQYDIFLGGASPIQYLESPQAATDQRLIIFRDSFASSLAPMLLEVYHEIILIDTRYIAAQSLGEYVDFQDAQVLFLYNTVLLNNSTMLK